MTMACRCELYVTPPVYSLLSLFNPELKEAEARNARLLQGHSSLNLCHELSLVLFSKGFVVGVFMIASVR